MKVSIPWLQKYFDSKLPNAQVLSDAFTFHVFEVEGVENENTILDLKVLPDRAHYALCHRGMATEISAILNLPLKKGALNGAAHFELIEPGAVKINNITESEGGLKIINTVPQLCKRYIGVLVENIEVTESPQWLKERLESIGARSINTIVDITNYVLFDLGQPLHTFDADKVVGAITIRISKPGEKMITLDGKEITLKGVEMVIADDSGPLALAGIKGGKRAEVTTQTKRIILEAACFDQTSVRRTANSVGIHNDSSKRFENGLPAELAPKGMEEALILINAFGTKKKEIKFSKPVDIYAQKQNENKVTLAPDDVSQSLGLVISAQEIKSLLERLFLTVQVIGGTKIEVTAPYFRLDLVIPADVVEEVGRLYGYDKIPAKLPQKSSEPVAINKDYFFDLLIKKTLVDCGCSEVYTYSLVKKGDLEVQSAVSVDRKALRTSIQADMPEILEKNSYNAPLLGVDMIKIFEIGKVFPQGVETKVLCLAVKSVKAKDAKNKDQQELKKLIEALSGVLSLSMSEIEKISKVSGTNSITEINLDALYECVAEPQISDLEKINISQYSPDNVSYKKISPFPFALRDIAVFVPEDVMAETVQEVININGGQWLYSSALFDVYNKQQPDGQAKVSYAFSLVFQSQDKTLSDQEVNTVMAGITAQLSARKWEVR